MEEGCADPDKRQRGKSGVSKRRPESTRGQSAPPGEQGQRRGRVQGGQHAPPPPGNSRYGAWPKGKALSMVHRAARMLGRSWGYLKAKAEPRPKISLLTPPGQRKQESQPRTFSSLILVGVLTSPSSASDRRPPDSPSSSRLSPSGPASWFSLTEAGRENSAEVGRDGRAAV